MAFPSSAAARSLSPMRQFPQLPCNSHKFHQLTSEYAEVNQGNQWKDFVKEVKGEITWNSIYIIIALIVGIEIAIHILVLVEHIVACEESTAK